MRIREHFILWTGLFGILFQSQAQEEPKLNRELPGVLDLTQTKTPEAVQEAFYHYIWQSFIALNWPNEPIKENAEGTAIISGFRGVPDPKKSILDQTGNQKDGMPFSVWERYKEPTEVFLPPAQWANYPIWNSPRPKPADQSPASRSLLTYSDNFAEYATDINQPYFFDNATGPLVDQHGGFVRYEVAVNEAFFTYIKHFKYYDADRQKADVQKTIAATVVPLPSNPTTPRPGFQRPPYGVEAYLAGTRFPQQGLVDLKAAWRPLDPAKGDQPERYLHRKIITEEDGSEQLMGLVALHILRYIQIKQINKKTGKPETILGYVASTFEQIDNVNGDPKADPPVKASFNDGGKANAIEQEYGFDYSIPPLASKSNPAPLAPVNIYRANSQKLSEAINTVNGQYQKLLDPSVFRYYEMIGTQNKHPGNIIDSDLDMNGHQGPITGVYTNTNNLINSALESYTQKNFSCILCHVRARPQGVPEKAWEDDYFKTLTFLLQAAQSKFSK